MPCIDSFQFGSVKKSSTTHALVHLVHYWLPALEIPNTIIRTCFIDFSKAFDLIDHNILMHKLQLLSVPPVLLNWCSSFLQNRQQQAKLRTCKSNWKKIKAGAPQGTKLGPLFFLIMVNDLSSELPLYKYVDYCSVSEVVRISKLDASKLQQEIDNVTQWLSANNMKLNVKKTKDLHFTVSFLHNQPSVEPLIVDNQTLEVVNTVKLLRVYLTSDPKWTTHVRTYPLKLVNAYMHFKVTSRQFIVVLSDLSWNMLVQSGIPCELKITGTLPEAGNLKPNIR